ncbi:protein mono-ADP-ribosyltransferase PARP3-like [Physella acuta]|uniref:protein mono-ADP-ribosyltransferase PARP3-like n=1 Tax=Physella acuta TaxID=109671 RepID=UPI0027DCA4DF|nr:protein mono-ADP-ribosyltransferase PARP3-like [Physella acuta]XP_059151096.1 protein mono-ADP-ribosyltransferase PARP3-like [Physella acuta]
MPPKRKTGGKATSSKAKKAKNEKEEEEIITPNTLKDKIAKLKEADKGKVKKHKPDSICPNSNNAQVYEDYDAMLNQTNIGQNNNKFYIIQILVIGGKYYTWNRWGRVGENGQNALKGPLNDPKDAIKDFEKKFKDKTKNAWSERDNFKPVKGKYTLLEMAGDEDEDQVDSSVIKIADDSNKTVAPCLLDKTTQNLMKLIFDNDMFKAALKEFDIDTKKMPLGKLSKAQIAKGFEALEAIEEAVNNKASLNKIKDLSSTFYTIIPHSVGRTVPPPLDTLEMIQKKYDMLAVLGDIELAQSIQKDREKASADTNDSTLPHPFDVNYGLLKCKLKLLDKKSNEFKVIKNYFEATKGTSGWRKQKLTDVWEVDREGEADRFIKNKDIEYRKLLWHGTNVAVVTAILKSGLRIMPHSGGRVGKGIYFASENDKSAGYVCPAQGKGIMFLNEVALGKQHKITQDKPSLVSAPKGYDSVLACGQQEPDSKFDTTLKFDGHDVIVPQGKPKTIDDYSSSSFYQSEYLVYREDQVYIRYLLLFDM